VPSAISARPWTAPDPSIKEDATMSMTKVLRGAAAAWLLTGSALAAPPPVETFFKPIAYPQMKISPAGTHVAVLYPANGATNLAVIDLTASAGAPLTGYAAPANVRRMYWKSNDRLIYEVDDYDHYGNKVHNIGAVNRDGKNHIMLMDNRDPVGATGYYSEEVLDLKLEDPSHVLLASELGSPGFPAIYDTDAVSVWQQMRSQAESNRSPFATRRIKVASAPGRNCEYTVDLTGEVRVCLSTEADLSRQLLYRADKSAPWQALAHFSEATGYIIPLGFAPDNKTLYVLSNFGGDTLALFEFDPAAKTLGKRLFGAPGVDIANGIFAADGRRLLGVRYQRDRSYVWYLDKNTAEIQTALSKAFPEYRVAIYSQSQDGKRAIIQVDNDQTPGRFYLYDDVKQNVSMISERAPWIDPKIMGTVTTIQFKSRDGLQLNGYLTVPPGREAKNLPLIVNPHGGPFGIRDYDGWNPDTQFLASRGYAVLQVNFRGSAGYGAAFQQAGKGEWGGRMQDDITDGVNWAVQQGLADKSRVAIMGASYGGYAAMMGLVLTPDVYRCGITLSGVSDLPEIFDPLVRTNNVQRERSREELRFWSDAFGESKNEGYLRDRSPVNNVQKIRAPVFIAHGVDDLVVPYSTASRFRDALQGAGKSVEFYGRPDEGHGFIKEANNVELFTKIEHFLQKCNPAN
jgi:dipeptidyl aminopeptidase/acylaminoacyl peptidase